MNTSLHFIGANGNDIDLLRNPYFFLTSVDGMTGVANDIATSSTPGMDGDRVNNVQTQPRTIVIDMRVKSDADVEEAKRYILRTIKPKQTGRLLLTQGDRVTEISGTVEEVAMPRFTNEVAMQVSLHCSEPYWQDMENVIVEISRIIDLHYFPVAFPVAGIPMGEYDLNMTRTYTNDGDADCGMTITIIALGDVVNPVIYKSDGSYIGVNDSMVVGDEIVINTTRGAKGITKNGMNILNKIRPGSTFLQLSTGDNELTVDSDGDTEGNVYFLISFKRRFV